MIDSRKARLALAIAWIVVSAIFLFAQLGHYSLWDDEALVALGAKGILKSGDTTALLDHNVVAYREGALLQNGYDRSTPPLPAYLTAASFALFGENAFAARLPFAICGLLSVIVLVRWLWREEIRGIGWLLFVMGFIANVSLFLFFRQCRYYAVALLCSTAIVYLYLNWNGRSRQLLWIALLSLSLFASNYMNYFALCGCLCLDYVLWGRKRRALSLKDWAILLLPQLVVAALIFSVWNPLATGNSVGLTSGKFSLKAWLMFASFCDISASEFGPGIFLLVSPLLAFFLRDRWLMRASVAFFAYIILVSLLSPQIMDEGTVTADIRYLAPLIPLCIFIGVRSVLILTRKASWLAIPLAVVVFGTNLCEGVTLRPFHWHSTLIQFVRELVHPPTDPFKPTAAWIRDNIPARASVWVVSAEKTYPLMFHAPEPIYAWQLPSSAHAQYPNLPAIHFLGDSAPDFIVVFGPQMKWVNEKLSKISAPRYERVAMIDVYWRDAHRPELLLHRFKSITDFKRSDEAVYVLKRTTPTQKLSE